VALLVDALPYKPEGRGFDCHWCFFHWRNLSGRTIALTASDRSEYQEYFLEGGGKGGRCVGLTTLEPSRAGCLEIWEPQTSVQACTEIKIILQTGFNFWKSHSTDCPLQRSTG
jgi:hypothetical protein